MFKKTLFPIGTIPHLPTGFDHGKVQGGLTSELFKKGLAGSGIQPTTKPTSAGAPPAETRPVKTTQDDRKS